MSEPLARTGSLQERIERMAAKAIARGHAEAVGQKMIDFSEQRRRPEDEEREIQERLEELRAS